MVTKLFYITIIILVFVFRRFLIKVPQLIYWLIVDKKKNNKNIFKPYGCWFFVGRQGAGKTMSLVWTLEKIREEYPMAHIYTNFGYVNETAPLERLTDLLDESLYNDVYGTVFAIDEIQNEFSSATSRDFPETVLSLVTQQRKQRILILCTSQVFTRVSKPLREQAFRVIECNTLLGRYTMCRHYDGIDYADSVDRSDNYRQEHRKRIEYQSFIQTDKLRDCFDSYKLIRKLSREGFSPKVANNDTKISVNVTSGKRSAH
ncbi:MAG: hypothetical protein IIY81_11640 [Lachnospiraceae bacterium]|nr:hypothetical protein [Lachnospiraceae bacterium]